jgi:hypothetical protein
MIIKQVSFKNMSYIKLPTSVDTNCTYGYPVFVQAGSYTGIVNPGHAMTRGDFDNDRVNYYMYNRKVKTRKN